MAKPLGSKKEPLRSPPTKEKLKMNASKGSASGMQKNLPLIFLGINLLIILQARIQLLAIPMERDEAGFSYIGHWLMKGKDLYVDIVDNKLPGLYLLYGVFTSMFGYNASGVHLMLLLANLITSTCFYFLLTGLYNRFVAAVATAFLSLLVLLPNVLGFAAHATQLLLPFVLGGFYFFWKGIRTERKSMFFFGGLLLGFAFIVKQQSIVFGILAAFLWWPCRLMWNKKESGKLPVTEWILLGIGGLLPLLMVVSYFKMTGRLDDLIFWAIKQPTRMADTFTTSRWDLFKNIIPKVTQHVEVIWLTAIAGCAFIFMSGFKKAGVSFGLLLAFMGIASVVIGAAFYQHYFVLALPGIALLAAIGLNGLAEKSGKNGLFISLGIASIFMLIIMVGARSFLFKPDYNVIHQSEYAINMFPELERIGKELSRRTAKEDRIGLMGSEPEVLVAADREGCSKHLFMYPLLSDPELSPPMQQEYLKEMKACMPEYIVWNVGVLSWTAGYDKLSMFTDLMAWIELHYVTTGIAEFRKDEPGILVWDDQLPSFQSQNDWKVYVFRKKQNE